MTMHRPALVTALTAFLTMTALGCSGGDADKPSGSGTVDASAASYAWTFDGDLEPVVGDHVILVADGPVTWSGEAVALDGASSSLVSRGPGPVDSTGGFTVTAWVNLRPTGALGTPAYAAVVSQVGSVAGAFYLGTREGRWDFTMKDADSNDSGHSFTAVGPEAQVDPKSWVHLAGAYDADAAEIRLYVNGARVSAAPFHAPWKSEGSLIVGRSLVRGTPGDFWPGAVADLRIHDHALDDEQLARAVGVGRPQLVPPTPPSIPHAASQLDGVYVYEMTPAESKRLEGLFGAEAAAAGFPGDASVVQRFAAGLWQQYYLVDGKPYLVNGSPEGDGGTATVKGDVLTLGSSAGASDYRWKLENGVLSLELVTLSWHHLGAGPITRVGRSRVRGGIGDGGGALPPPWRRGSRGSGHDNRPPRLQAGLRCFRCTGDGYPLGRGRMAKGDHPLNAQCQSVVRLTAQRMAG